MTTTQHIGAAGEILVQSLMSIGIPSTLTVNNYFGVLQGVLWVVRGGICKDGGASSGAAAGRGAVLSAHV